MSYLHIENLYKAPELLECYALEKIHGCVRFDSLVTMADGTEKPISAIIKGDYVKSYDETNGQFISTEVDAVVIQEKSDQLPWCKIDLDNGRKLICTIDHPIRTTRGWIAAKNITDTDKIVSCN